MAEPPLTQMQGQLCAIEQGLNALLERPEPFKQLDAIGQGLVTLLERPEPAKKMEEVAKIMSEGRAAVTEAVGIMHSQMSDVLMRLDGLGQHSKAVAHERTRRPAWHWLVTGLVAGSVLMGCVWLYWPMSQQEHFGLALAQTVREQYASMPKGTKEAMARVYGQFGYHLPGGGK